MGHVLVLYYSKDGNARKMANYIAEGASEISGTEVIIKSVDEAGRDDIYWCDGLALGSPTQLGTVSAAMKKFWEDLLPEWQKIDGKIGCAFSSQGGWGGGAELTCQALMTIIMNFGFLVFGVPDYAGHQFTTHYGAIQAGEPRAEKEIESCRRLGKRLGLSGWQSISTAARICIHLKDITNVILGIDPNRLIQRCTVNKARIKYRARIFV